MAARKTVEKRPSPRVNILLAVLGTTPAVLTEALYELIVGAHTRQQEPFIPDEIHVITTATGDRVLREKLFSTGQGAGKLADLVREYGDIFMALEIQGFFPKTFPTGSKHVPDSREKTKGIPLFVNVIADDSGTPLVDIRSATDIEIAETTTWNHVSTLAAHENVEIRALVAGGRKTLSNILHNIMTFLGRPQDKLYHVLVNEPFDNPFLEPPFFFPPKLPVDYTLVEFVPNVDGLFPDISVREAKKVGLSPVGGAGAARWIKKTPEPSCRAQTELAEIRFPRLRGGIPASLLEAGRNRKSFVEGYRDCLNIADELAVSQHELMIDLHDQAIRVGKNCVITGLTPVDLSFFLHIAIERANYQLQKTSGEAVDFCFDLEYFAREENLKKYFGHYLGLTMLTTHRPCPIALGSNADDGRLELQYSQIMGCGGDSLKPEDLLDKALGKAPWPKLIPATISAIQTVRNDPRNRGDLFEDLKNKVAECLSATNKTDPVRAYVQAKVLAPDKRAVKTFFDDRLTTCKKAVIDQLGPALANQVTFIRSYQNTKTSYHLPIEASRVLIRDTNGRLFRACPPSVEQPHIEFLAGR